MKKQSNNTFNSISTEHTIELTNVVKETLANGFLQPRNFSAADLWNIQRRSRTMVSRRSFAY
jgi:hypothetical protein